MPVHARPASAAQPGGPHAHGSSRPARVPRAGAPPRGGGPASGRVRRDVFRQAGTGDHRPEGQDRGAHRLLAGPLHPLDRRRRRRVQHPGRGADRGGRRPGHRGRRLRPERWPLVLLLRPGVLDRHRPDRHRPPGAARRGLGLGRAGVEDAHADRLRERPRRRALAGGRDRLGQPVQGRPGPGGVAARARHLPLRARVGRGEAPLAAEREPGGAERAVGARVGMPEPHDHGDARAPTGRLPSTGGARATVVPRVSRVAERPSGPAPSVWSTPGSAGDSTLGSRP